MAGAQYFPEIRNAWWYEQPWEYDRSFITTDYKTYKKINVRVHYKHLLRTSYITVNSCYLPFIYQSIYINLTTYE